MSDLADDLRSAWDETQGAANDNVESAPPADLPGNAVAVDAGGGSAAGADAPDSGATDAGSRVRDASGRFAKADPKAKAASAVGVAPPAAPVPSPAGQSAGTGGVGGSISPAVPAAGQLPTHKPPQSWSALEREHWATIPSDAQAAIARREREFASAIKEHAEAKRLADEFNAAVNPYAHYIAAEGSTPVAAVQNLMRTAVALRTAPPQQKAQLVAGIIQQYGIDIQALDGILAGQPANSDGGGQQFRDPRFDQFIAQMEQAKQAQAQARAQQIQSEIETFGADREFFDDVRDDMADLLAAAAKRGKAMTLEDAYNRALKLNDNTSKVLQQREEARSRANPNGSTQRARVASSSVRNEPAGVMQAANEDVDLRGAIEAAWAAHSR